MIEALKFVSLATTKSELKQEFSHFKIRDGKVMSSNGELTICSPININITAYPNADKFTKSIAACDDTTVMNLTKAKRLSIKSGKFKSFVPCLDDNDITDDAYGAPAGGVFDVPESFTSDLIATAKFAGTDTLRLWSCGVLVDHSFMYATNNVMVVQSYHGVAFPGSILIPAQAMLAVSAAKKPIKTVQTDGVSLTFHFDDDLWIRTQLINEHFHDSIKTIFDIHHQDAVLTDIPESFYDMIKKIKPFLADRKVIHITSEGIATHKGDEDGSSFTIDIEGANSQIFHHEHLHLLKGTATKWDISKHPNPCVFVGNNMRGVMIGLSA